MKAKKKTKLPYKTVKMRANEIILNKIQHEAHCLSGVYDRYSIEARLGILMEAVSCILENQLKSFLKD